MKTKNEIIEEIARGIDPVAYTAYNHKMKTLGHCDEAEIYGRYLESKSSARRALAVMEKYIEIVEEGDVREGDIVKYHIRGGHNMVSNRYMYAPYPPATDGANPIEETLERNNKPCLTVQKENTHASPK